MSTSPEQAPHEAALFRTIREWGITRGDNGVIGGVAEGLGDRIGMARVPARIILVVAAFPLTALVLLGYAAAWALLPDRKGNIILQNFGRGIPNVGALIGIGILTLLGLGSFDNGSGLVFNSGSWGRDIPWSGASSWGAGNTIILILAILVPLVIIGGVITAIVLLVKKNGNGPKAGPGAVYAMPPTSQSGSTATPAAHTAAPTAGYTDAPTASAPVTEFTSTPPTPVAAAAAPPARQWAPVPPAPPLTPRRPRVPGPGRSFYLLTLAWVAIAAAAAAWLERDDRLSVHPVIAGAVIFVTGLGVLLIAISLAGRKLGFLGFVGIASLIPLMVFAGNAEGLRTAYADHGGITNSSDFTVAFDTVEPTPPFDPTLKFPGVYANVYFDGYCQEGDWQDYGSNSVARLNLVGSGSAVASDSTVDITAEVTYVTITSGTNITLTGDINAPATVVFADRGFTCDFGNTDQKYMELTNPDAPTINLVVHDALYTNTIVIKEVTS